MVGFNLWIWNSSSRRERDFDINEIDFEIEFEEKLRENWTRKPSITNVLWSSISHISILDLILNHNMIKGLYLPSKGKRTG